MSGTRHSGRFADDVADLGRRLLREMAGVKTTSLEKMPPGRVLVARRLLPSDTVALPRRAVAGIVLEFGGPGSHAALLAEALGIPTVRPNPERDGEDCRRRRADRGRLSGGGGDQPGRGHASALRPKKSSSAQAQKRSGEARRPANQPARWTARASRCWQTLAAARTLPWPPDNGADGVGLYRMEQFYLSRKTPPRSPELLAEFRKRSRRWGKSRSRCACWIWAETSRCHF